LNTEYTFAFDWDWFIRAEIEGVEFMPTAQYLSIYRIHEAHKSGSGGEKRIAELKKIVATYNEPILSKAFSDWMSIYSTNFVLSKIMDLGVRKNLALMNFHLKKILFPQLTSEDYRNIISMK